MMRGCWNYWERFGAEFSTVNPGVTPVGMNWGPLSP